MPDSKELARQKASEFRETENDYSRFVAALDALGVSKGARLFDFGCSWGYGSWQFMNNGHQVESYEISQPRRNYARQMLGCTVHSSLANVEPGFDIFFSSHVLEHVPSPQKVIEFATSILHPHGLFVAFTPNGSQAHREASPARWQKLWGLVHPNFLDVEYYHRCFHRFPHLLASDPYDFDKIRSWGADKRDQQILDQTGPELMCVVKMEQRPNKLKVTQAASDRSVCG